MVAFVPLSAYAAVDDGNLRKITSDGQYEIGMSWQPAGPIEPGVDYLFNFEIREGMSQKNIDDASFNFDIVKDGTITDSTSFTTGTLTKTISFEEPGLVNLLLTDVNSSTQQIDFTFPVGNEKSSKNGISYAMKNYNAEPKIFFCGNSKDLATCLDKELSGDAKWWGKVTIMIYAPGWNVDSEKRDRIGATTNSALTITARGDGNSNAELGVCNGKAKHSLDSPSAIWKEDLFLGASYLRPEILKQIIFTKDQFGNALSSPDTVLICAGYSPNYITSQVTVKSFVRNDVNGTWGESQIVQGSFPAGENYSIRDIEMYVDKQTGFVAINIVALGAYVEISSAYFLTI